MNEILFFTIATKTSEEELEIYLHIKLTITHLCIIYEQDINIQLFIAHYSYKEI